MSKSGPVNAREFQVKRIKKLRIAVFVCLLITSCFFGLGAYMILDELEEQRQHQLYETIIAEFETVTLKSIIDESYALEVTAAILADQCPDASSWPNCKMSSKTFSTFTYHLQEMSSYQAISFSPILKTTDISTYETFSTDFWEESGFGNYNISENIFARTQDGDVYREVDTSSSKGIYDIVVPVFQISPIESNNGAVLFNIYSEENRARTIDYAISANSTLPSTGISEFIYLIQDDDQNTPASLIMHPIVPLNDNTTVGLAVGVLRWDTFFSKYVPRYAEGITVVLSDGVSTVPYSFVQDQSTGIAEAVHNPGYQPSHKNSWSWKTIELNSLGSSSYTITMHFEDSFAEEYRTNNPYYLMSVSLIVTLVTSLLFVLYDHFTKREFVEQQIVSKTRREFVRYISHEIRTPMNTIHIGMSILFDEISSLFSSLGSEESETIVSSLTDWLSLISNVTESSEAALLVLNDMINYDKIQMNLIQLEKEPMNSLSLLHRTIGLFTLQAKRKNINLIVNLVGIEKAESCGTNSNDDTTTEDVSYTYIGPIDLETGELELTNSKVEVEKAMSSALLFYGDKIKLAQVVRNLVSNALKFTPEFGTVEITGTYDAVGVVDDEKAVSDEEIDDCLVRKGCIVFRVKDSGAGMSANNLSELFQEGKQFNANKLQAGEGSGLGLFIAKQLVELHFGSLRAFSEGEGKGAEFVLQIPTYIRRSNGEDKSSWPSEIVEDECLKVNDDSPLSERIQFFMSSMSSEKGVAEDVEFIDLFNIGRKPAFNNIEMGNISNQQSPLSLVKSKAQARVPLAVTYGSLSTDDHNVVEPDETLLGSGGIVDISKLNVLIVDDAKSTQKIMERLFRKTFSKIYVSSNGQECIDTITDPSCDVDIILLDYEMPVMNGPAAAKILRSKGCKIPIIGITGNVLSDEQQLFLESGVNAVLAKPFEMDSFLECVTSVMIG